VTRVGKFLRKYKIDELPQLINVLKGDMSLVGPRPEVPKYVEIFRKDFERILAVRPGITDPASLQYVDEEAVLSNGGDWEKQYLSRILPDKIRLSAGYIEEMSMTGDLKLILKTVFKSWIA
jgi:lipopolysaccharide/colanic/teichoic acid biosynthesis glycosyltransferase